MNLNEAIEKLSDTAKETLKKCKSLEEIIKLFADNGIEISKEEIQKVLKQKSEELSDDELESVTGGNIIGDLIQELLGHFAKKFLNDQKDK